MLFQKGVIGVEDCIFCRIVKGEIPASKVFESDSILSFLDINPVSRGHTLVIPRLHYETLEDFPDELLAELSKAVKQISAAAARAVGADGYNIQMSNRPAAGQVVPHAHFHIIPRFEGDGLKHWPGRAYGEGEAEAILQAIRKSI